MSGSGWDQEEILKITKNQGGGPLDNLGQMLDLYKFSQF